MKKIIFAGLLILSTMHYDSSCSSGDSIPSVGPKIPLPGNARILAGIIGCITGAACWWFEKNVVQNADFLVKYGLSWGGAYYINSNIINEYLITPAKTDAVCAHIHTMHSALQAEHNTIAPLYNEVRNHKSIVVQNATLGVQAAKDYVGNLIKKYNTQKDEFARYTKPIDELWPTCYTAGIITYLVCQLYSYIQRKNKEAADRQAYEKELQEIQKEQQLAQTAILNAQAASLAPILYQQATPA